MQPSNFKRTSRNSRRKQKSLNRKIRQLSCWNCFQFGHVRFQCPFPKSNVCSFCRRPGIRSCDCPCPDARNHFNVINNVQIENLNNEIVDVPQYNLNVMVPVNGNDENVHYEEVNNIIVFLENDLNEEEDKDYIDIHAENEDLSEM